MSRSCFSGYFFDDCSEGFDVPVKRIFRSLGLTNVGKL